MKNEKKITKIIGIIFLVFGSAAILNSIFILKNISILVWLCHPALIILGIGFSIRNKGLIQSQLNILTIPLIIWTLDFLQFLFTKNSVFGISEYFFQQMPISSRIITSQHLFTLPLAYFGLKYLKEKSKNPLKISILAIGILFILSRTFGPEKNINMTYSILGIITFYYPVLWLGGILLGIFGINFLINKIYN